MPLRIGAAEQNSFHVPLHHATNVRRTVSQCQIAAETLRFVALRAVQQQVGVNRGMAGKQFIVDDGPIPFDVIDRLVEHVVLAVGAGPDRDVPMVLGPGHKANAGILDFDIINRHSDREGPGGSDRPVGSVLVPGDDPAVPGKLVEELAPQPTASSPSRSLTKEPMRGWVSRSQTAPYFIRAGPME